MISEGVEGLVEYAVAEGAAGFDVHEVRICVCGACGHRVFGVEGDLEQRAVMRICRACGAEHFVADSGRYWSVVTPAVMVCECDAEDFDVAVGFSMYDGGEGIRALAITSRCVACGGLGYWVDWMVRTGELELLDLA